MINTNVTNFRKDLFNYLEMVIDFNGVINVKTKKGGVVVVSEEDYSNLLETLYLVSSPGMKDRLIQGLNAKEEDCVEFEW